MSDFGSNPPLDPQGEEELLMLERLEDEQQRLEQQAMDHNRTGFIVEQVHAAVATA